MIVSNHGSLLVWLLDKARVQHLEKAIGVITLLSGVSELLEKSEDVTLTPFSNSREECLERSLLEGVTLWGVHEVSLRVR